MQIKASDAGKGVGLWRVLFAFCIFTQYEFCEVQSSDFFSPHKTFQSSSV